MNEKGLSSIFVIFRVVDKLLECRETYKYFKRKKKLKPICCKGQGYNFCCERLSVWTESIKPHSNVAEFNLVQCLEAKIPHRTTIRVIFKFQNYSWISFGDF